MSDINATRIRAGVSEDLGWRALIILLASLVVWRSGAGFLALHTFDVAGKIYRVSYDDVMITLRVARNFAFGLGPYFNPGEAVAANTSLFWPMILAPIYWVLDLDRAVVAACLISMTATIATLAAVCVAARTIANAAIVVAILAISPSLQHYGWSAWEHVPQMLFVTCGFLLMLDRVRLFSAPNRNLYVGLGLLACAFLLRPDGLVLLAPATFFVALRCRKDPMCFAVLAAVAAAVGLYYGLHLYFYGSLVPNTYYFKANPGVGTTIAGIRYLISNLHDGGNTLLVAAALGLIVLNIRRASPSEALLGVSLALVLAYIAFVGGDYFVRGRFLLCVTPIAVYFVVERLSESWRRFDVLRPVALVMLGITCALQASMANFRENHPIKAGHGPIVAADFVAQGATRNFPIERVGNYLSLIPIIRSRLSPEDGRIGLFFLGSLSYYLPEYRITDFYGKADPVIAKTPVKWGPLAHNKWDIEVSIGGRQVMVIPIGRPDPERARIELAQRSGFGGARLELVLHPIIQNEYVYISPEELGLRSGGFLVRNDLVGRLQLSSQRPGP